MAVGFTNPDAVHIQIEQTIQDGIAHARRKRCTGRSAVLCVECGDCIPEGRRTALRGVQTCLACQEELDGNYKLHETHNRKVWHRSMR